MPVTAQDIREALKAIRLPAGGQSLPDSGRLSQIVIEGERVAFSIAIDQTEAQAMASVREAAQQCVEAMPGVSRALVSLTADRPAGESGDAPAAAQPLREPGNRKTPSPNARAQKIEGVKHVVAVASGKGGVGKSTTACNIALGLAALGLRVGVMDADIYGPSMPKLFGLSGKPKAGPDRKIVPLENYGVKVMSIGFMVDEETPMIWRGPMVMSAITQMLHEVNWGEANSHTDCDDRQIPPGTADATMTMAHGHDVIGAVIVLDAPPGIYATARCAYSGRRHGSMRIENSGLLGIVEEMAECL